MRNQSGRLLSYIPTQSCYYFVSCGAAEHALVAGLSSDGGVYVAHGDMAIELYSSANQSWPGEGYTTLLHLKTLKMFLCSFAGMKHTWKPRSGGPEEAQEA